MGRVRESNARLSDRLQEVKLENKTLRQVSADYERVKRALWPGASGDGGTEEKQREQAERAASGPGRSFSRDER